MTSKPRNCRLAYRVLHSKMLSSIFRLAKDPVTLPKWSKWLIGAVAAGGLAAGGYTAIDSFTDLNPGEVYVIDSGTSKSYHNSKDCPTLKNIDRHRIKKISEEEAIHEGRKPCKRCYN